MGPANPTIKRGAPANGESHSAREPVVMAATLDPAERPLGRISPRQIVVLVVGSAVMVAGLVVIAPALADLPDVWSKLSTGHLGWLTLALGLEALSFVGHAILFRAVSLGADGDHSRIGFRASTEIT